MTIISDIHEPQTPARRRDLGDVARLYYTNTYAMLYYTKYTIPYYTNGYYLLVHCGKAELWDIPFFEGLRFDSLAKLW